MNIYEVKIRDDMGNSVSATRVFAVTHFKSNGNIHIDKDKMDEALDKLKEAIK